MSMKKPWARPQDFSDIPGCQRVVCNVYLQQYPELALIMWFAAPGTRSQLTVRLLVAGLAAMNGQVDPENPEPAPPLPPRRTRTQAASPVEPARSGRKFPSSLATPPGPFPGPSQSVSMPQAEQPLRLDEPSVSLEPVVEEPRAALPQFQVSAASLEAAHTEPEEDRPISAGLALLRSF